MAESVAAFDRLARLVPDIAPVLWQRGIALYELGRFDDCAAQFAAHHGADSADAENATWHFLCVVRQHGLDRARASILSIRPDPRVMRESIYALIRGDRRPEDVLASASLDIEQFYANLYVGLYLEATGDRARALECLTRAASEPLRSYGGFMNVVARVHLERMRPK